MRLRFASIFVSATVTVAIVQPPGAATQQLEHVTDPDAYAIYAVLVRQAWATRSKDTLLLQQETETSSLCRSSVPVSDPEWVAVENNFKQENARGRLLERLLPIDISYRLVPRAEIQADDARLALKYPGIWQRRPGSMEYAAVSMVGFNPTKTKAMVHVRFRSSGGVHAMELRDGRWVDAQRGGCRWIA
jgi:hypothetical protein